MKCENCGCSNPKGRMECSECGTKMGAKAGGRGAKKNVSAKPKAKRVTARRGVDAARVSAR